MRIANTICKRARAIRLGILSLFLLLLAGCAVGPRYSRPTATVPPAFKELPQNWKTAQPSDEVARGKWWEIFRDPQLNRLEEQINVSNQNIKAAEAQFRQARALVRYYRSNYYPTLTTSPSVTRSHSSGNRPPASQLSGKTFTDYLLPGDLSYEVDVWGRVRKTVESARENAQASAADLASVNLIMHSELASDYLQMRSLDAERQLLDSTVAAYQRALELTENRYHGGVASGVDVAQAQTQLKTTLAQAMDLDVQRSQFEHAIAALIGQPASTFSLARLPLTTPPPVIPAGLPSELLERRPDIAAAERRVASANAQIGVAKAAYYPTITLGASSGFESGTPGTWLSGPSAFWAAGPAAALTLLDFGRRRAASEQAWATYDQTVANYRETVLTAFQQVEDNLSALRLLEGEAQTQNEAITAAQHSLELSTNRYKGGVTTYLEVITAQTTALSDERTAVQILGRRMTAAVNLIQALGGGWDASQLPSARDLSHPQPRAGGQ
jgi:NodT family efflux transporter outer membrane factor (OMF) lipoprotein